VSKPTHDDLRLRKLMLQQRSAVQRQMLAIQTKRLMAPLVQTVGRVQAGGQWVREHPAVVAGVAALVLAWRPRAVLGLAARSLGLWSTVRRVLPIAIRLWAQWKQRS
jgi:hypothetical protein